MLGRFYACKLRLRKAADLLMEGKTVALPDLRPPLDPSHQARMHGHKAPGKVHIGPAERKELATTGSDDFVSSGAELCGALVKNER
jgi:hypothetical protein